MPRREMDGVEIGEFLDDQLTGTLGLAKGDDAYAIPVSYTYKAAEGACYFRFGYGPDSQKRRFIEATDHATFVVYDHTEAGWQSVLVEGTLEVLSEGELDATITESVRDIRVPYFDVFGRPHDELEFVIARLDATTVSGITEG